MQELKQKHFDPVWHSHSEYQLFLVLEGTGTRFIGDSIKSFGPGELIFTGPHVPHLWRCDEIYFAKKSNTCAHGIVVYFNGNFLGDHIVVKDEMSALKKLFSRSMRGIEYYGRKKAIVSDMLRELPALQGLPSVISLLQILDILAGCKEFNYISSREHTGAIREHESNRLNMVYAYVLKHFRQKITASDMVSMLHMTPTSFSRYFSGKNNKSFSKFLQEIRIKHACKLLTETEMPVTEIAYECGFNTISNFNKQFKEMMYKKPLEYKREFMAL